MAKKTIFTSPTDLETDLVKRGYTYVIGIDEAGRGALAGGLALGYCALPLNRSAEWLKLTFEGITDSKRLSAKRRQELFEVIQKNALACGAVHATAQHIDECGLSQTVKDYTALAIEDAIFEIGERSKHDLSLLSPDQARIFILGDKGLYIDYHPIHFPYPMADYVGGEMKSLSIAAASIMAKVSRDKIMETIESEDHIQWNFAKHKGYGTADHISAIRQYGVHDIHRKSFAPIPSILNERGLN